MAKTEPNPNPEMPGDKVRTEQAETAAETLQFRTASGATFWRCGVQFDGAW